MLLQLKVSLNFLLLLCATSFSFFFVFIGSYDHTVKMYDARSGSCVMSMDHGVPVESVLMFSSGGLFISAGMCIFQMLYYITMPVIQWSITL